MPSYTYYCNDNYPISHNQCTVCGNVYLATRAVECKCCICNVTMCPLCSIDINKVEIRHYFDPMVRLDKGSECYVCLLCLAKAEMEWIRREPLSRLLLYINHDWLTACGEDMYQAMFTGGSFKTKIGRYFIYFNNIRVSYHES